MERSEICSWCSTKFDVVSIPDSGPVSRRAVGVGTESGGTDVKEEDEEPEGPARGVARQ